jgi:hypothetical protein
MNYMNYMNYNYEEWCLLGCNADVSEELSASIRVTKIGELEMLALSGNRRTLVIEALNSSETSIVTRVTWRKIPEEAILQDSNLRDVLYKSAYPRTNVEFLQFS